MKAQAQANAKKQSRLRPVAPKARVEFELNPYYEQLLEMREQKPAAYRVMSAATHLAVEAYVKAKRAASIEEQATRAAA